MSAILLKNSPSELDLAKHSVQNTGVLDTSSGLLEKGFRVKTPAAAREALYFDRFPSTTQTIPSRMLTAREFQAAIVVEGEALESHKPTTINEQHSEGYVESTSGKAFKLRWKNTYEEDNIEFHPTTGVVLVDGVKMSGVVMSDIERPAVVNSGDVASKTTIKAFTFAPINTSDEVAECSKLSASKLRSIGTIELKIYRVAIRSSSQPITSVKHQSLLKSSSVENMTIYEKEKKASDHIISTKVRKTKGSRFRKVIRLDEEDKPYVSFKWHYSSRAMLLARDIIPRLELSSSQSSAGPVTPNLRTGKKIFIDISASDNEDEEGENIKVLGGPPSHMDNPNAEPLNIEDSNGDDDEEEGDKEARQEVEPGLVKRERVEEVEQVSLPTAEAAVDEIEVEEAAPLQNNGEAGPSPKRSRVLPPVEEENDEEEGEGLEQAEQPSIFEEKDEEKVPTPATAPIDGKQQPEDDTAT